jgi:GH24 family phage-related lysozyme (muramidase)
MGGPTPDPPLPFMMSKQALDLVAEFEGLDQGGWPGGASGCTIGVGYDLGYHTLGQFGADWRSWLTVNDFAKLRALVGITGHTARDRVRIMGPVSIPLDAAEFVFLHSSMPRAERATLSVFPGADKLPTNAADALVSLVFNRGTRLTDNDPNIQERREMRGIKSAVARGDLLAIAVELRSMKRLWTGTLHHPYDVKMTGLIRRREAEAALVESCIVGGAEPSVTHSPMQH